MNAHRAFNRALIRLKYCTSINSEFRELAQIIEGNIDCSSFEMMEYEFPHKSSR